MDDKQYQKLCRWTNRADCSVLACRPIMVEIALRKGFEIYSSIAQSILDNNRPTEFSIYDKRSYSGCPGVFIQNKIKN